LRIALSQGSKATCKTFMSKLKGNNTQFTTHGPMVVHLAPFTFPSTLTTMMGTYYYVKVLPSRKLSRRGRGAQCERLFMSKTIEQLEGRSESWEIF
jgi:hypothetical protein